MEELTSEQFLHEKARIAGMVGLAAFEFAKSVHESLQKVSLEGAALQLALLRKRILTGEELEKAIAEMQAARAVERALDPKMQELEAELRRLADELHKLTGEGDREEG